MSINERIAKVKKWVLTPRRPNELSYYSDQKGYYKGNPKWSSEMGCAWELVEELNAKGFRYLMNGKTFEGQHRCTIHEGAGSTKADGVAPTAPEAICLAWLEVMEGN